MIMKAFQSPIKNSVDLILCHDINERNLKIASEVIKLHKKFYPVLVIFQDLNEISALHNLLSNDIKNINIFDGKNKIQTESILDDFKSKNDLQQSFINRFKSKREWIFTGLIKTQKFTDDQI